MATLYGKYNTDSRQDVPSSKILAAYQHGRVRRAYDEFTLSGELEDVGDVIKMMKLPANCVVVDARFVAPSDGTSGQYDIGWEANGTESADDDGFFEGSVADSGDGAVDAKLLATRPGYNKFFTEETQVSITVAEATTASNGDTIQLEIFYIVD